jgi:hypothetical protein
MTTFNMKVQEYEEIVKRKGKYGLYTMLPNFRTRYIITYSEGHGSSDFFRNVLSLPFYVISKYFLGSTYITSAMDYDYFLKRIMTFFEIISILKSNIKRP